MYVINNYMMPFMLLTISHMLCKMLFNTIPPNAAATKKPPLPSKYVVKNASVI